MARLIKQTQNNYTNISNQIIRDERLSWKARGIFIYLWSQANEWQFYVSEIAKHATDGEKALRSGIKELEKFGYLERKNRQKATGGFDGMDWLLTDSPKPERYDQNSVEGKKDENEPKKSPNSEDAQMDEKRPILSQNVSDTKRVGRETCRTRNGALRNNNNKNYQNKEISTNKSSSSSSNQDGLEDDDEQILKINSRVSKLWSAIRDYNSRFDQNTRPNLPQLKQIRLRVSKLSDESFEQLDEMFKERLKYGLVDNPIAYLLVMLDNDIQAEKFWNQIND